MNNECWLPELLCYDEYNGDWNVYQTAFYAVFKHDFLDSKPVFEGKAVNIRRQPIEFGKEESFFHITCQDYEENGNRLPDINRCERIRWVRSFIENYRCDPARCEGCDGIKVWREPYKSKVRVNLLFEEERYMVVLEPRDNYCLLITAFYIERDHALETKLRRYRQYRQAT